MFGPIPGLRLFVAPIGSKRLFSDRLQHLGSTPAAGEEQPVEALVREHLAHPGHVAGAKRLLPLAKAPGRWRGDLTGLRVDLCGALEVVVDSPEPTYSAKARRITPLRASGRAFDAARSA